MDFPVPTAPRSGGNWRLGATMGKCEVSATGRKWRFMAILYVGIDLAKNALALQCGGLRMQTSCLRGPLSSIVA